MKQEEAFDQLNAQLKDIPKVEIRTLSLAVLPRLMGVLDSHSHQCSHCRKYSNDGAAFVSNIRPLFQQDANINKRFEQWVEETQKHLKATHKQHVKGRTTATYTTLGMISGSCLGALISLMIASGHLMAGVSIGWAIGVLIGYIGGKLKEQKLNQKQLLY
ncbi:MULTISPECIES: hypothetical protein [unclassified Carboxylicivirga]|uniref:hypothetical protein n=1 Tax=Carboxylicivirga TaxID=1628153 RepID=UPI003D34AA7E